MATQWYWLEQDSERGPVSFQDLVAMIRDCSLDEDDLVRPHYSDEWQKTDTVVGLFSMAKRTPRPKPERLSCPIETELPGSNEEAAPSTIYALEKVARDISSLSFQDSTTMAGGETSNGLVSKTQSGLDPDLETLDLANGSGSISTVIDEAAAAWDERHGNSNASGACSGTGGLHAKNLFRPIAALVLLPWRFVLVCRFAISTVLSRIGKLFELNAVSETAETGQKQPSLTDTLEVPTASELPDLPKQEASGYAGLTSTELRTDLEGGEFQQMLLAADDIAVDSPPCESVKNEGELSMAISAATAAWDHRHAETTMNGDSVESPPQHAGKLAALGSWLVRLPWQMILGIAFSIQLLLSPVVKLVVANRRVSQTIAIAVLVGTFYWIVSPMFVTQNQVYSTLDLTFTEFMRLRSDSSDEASFDRFRQHSLRKLNSFVPRLEGAADVSDPASLSLLAVARDYLPRLLNEQSRTSDEMEFKIRKHLEIAKANLVSGQQTASKPEFSLLLLISLNLGLVCAGIWFFARDRVIKAAHIR